MKSRIIIQSRLSSRRLPAKALLPIGGFPSVILCAKRAANQGRETIVATSADTQDDALVEQLKNFKIPFVRGPLEDVLQRYILASTDLVDSDIIIRLTADNLFPDGEFIEEALNYFISHQLDYLTSTHPDSILPYGMSVEIFHVGLLRAAALQNEREHFTVNFLSVAQKINQFTPHMDDTFNAHHLRCTLDTFDDYTNNQKIFSGIDDAVTVSWRTLLSRLINNFKISKPFPKQIKNNQPTCEFTLGTVQLGMPYGRTNTHGMPYKSEALSIIHESIKLGVKTIDTASVYGISEKILGEALQGGKATQVSVITKLHPLDWIDDQTSKESIIAGIEASVFRSCTALKTETLDTLLLHRWKHFYLNDGLIWKHLLKLKKEGIIQRLGVSVTTPNDAISALKQEDIMQIQIPFNLLDWRWLNPAFQEALSKRPEVVVHVRSALLQGILAHDSQFWPMVGEFDNQKTIELLKDFVEQFGRKNRADLCFAYVRSFPWISSVVVGIETRQQLYDNLDLFQYAPLQDYQVREIQKTFAHTSEKLLDPAGWT